jgi:hypothetical protein
MTPSDYDLPLTILELQRLSRRGRFKVSPFHAATILVLATLIDDCRHVRASVRDPDEGYLPGSTRRLFGRSKTRGHSRRRLARER